MGLYCINEENTELMIISKKKCRPVKPENGTYEF